MVISMHTKMIGVRAIKTVIDKIMGESEFKGTPNENVWCNKWQTRL